MLQEFILRKMTQGDLDEVMIIEEEAFALPWSRNSYLMELRNSFSTYIVCDVAGDIVGYGGMWIVFEEAHITNVAVSSDFRKRGLGKALMLELEKIAQELKAIKILLEVRPSNSSALKMYRSLEYTETFIRKAYYSDNSEDAFVMTKLLF